MSGRIVILVQKTKQLRIYDDDNNRLQNPIVLENVTHVKKGPIGWYDIFAKKHYLGYVSNVKEVQEEW